MGASVWMNRIRQVFIFSIVALASNFEYGFSTTYLNTPVEQFKVFLNESYAKRGHIMTESTYTMLWNLILNIWFVGFFIGIWFSPLLNDKFGRKIGFIIGCTVALLGAVLRLLAVCLYQPILLIVGRFLTAMCEAVTYQSCILYLQECSPTHKRGMMTFLSEISYSFMCLVGMMLGTSQMLGDDLVALMTFAVPFCMFFLAALFFMPETPKFLLISRMDSAAAKRSVRFYHGSDCDVDKVITEIILESESHETQTATTWSSIKELFTEPHLRRAILLSISALQNTVALWSMLLSSTYFLEEIGLDRAVASWSSTAMTLGYVLGTVAGSTWIEKFGRRTILLSFTITDNIVLILYVICAEMSAIVGQFKYFCLVLLILYAFIYGSGVGPISWFISSELVPLKYRSLTQSTCSKHNGYFHLLVYSCSAWLHPPMSNGLLLQPEQRGISHITKYGTSDTSAEYSLTTPTEEPRSEDAEGSWLSVELLVVLTVSILFFFGSIAVALYMYLVQFRRRRMLNEARRKISQVVVTAGSGSNSSNSSSASKEKKTACSVDEKELKTFTCTGPVMMQAAVTGEVKHALEEVPSQSFQRSLQYHPSMNEIALIGTDVDKIVGKNTMEEIEALPDVFPRRPIGRMSSAEVPDVTQNSFTASIMSPFKKRGNIAQRKTSKRKDRSKTGAQIPLRSDGRERTTGQEVKYIPSETKRREEVEEITQESVEPVELRVEPRRAIQLEAQEITQETDEPVESREGHHSTAQYETQEITQESVDPPGDTAGEGGSQRIKRPETRQSSHADVSHRIAHS
ncbi:hypothetical protein Q1695_011857 [Nippostrongylus brasiliensis]|nr:hypothetical protein Q1695_011857 [Nippostrongylus brasiliensis]